MVFVCVNRYLYDTTSYTPVKRGKQPLLNDCIFIQVFNMLESQLLSSIIWVLQMWTLRNSNFLIDEVGDEAIWLKNLNKGIKGEDQFGQTKNLHPGYLLQTPTRVYQIASQAAWASATGGVWIAFCVLCLFASLLLLLRSMFYTTRRIQSSMIISLLICLAFLVLWIVRLIFMIVWLMWLSWFLGTNRVTSHAQNIFSVLMSFIQMSSE